MWIPHPIKPLRTRCGVKHWRGTQPGRTFRLKGKGITHLRGYGRGDHLIETVVTVPTNLTKKQEELLKEFDRLSSETTNK